MKLPVLIHEARLGPDRFRVVQPARPISKAVLVDHDRHLGMYLDGECASRIAGLWLLAARSPRSLIHLPMRTGAHPTPEVSGPRLDLVLLHHSLRFAPSQWKHLRGRLRSGRPQTAEFPVPERTEPDAARHYRENRDLFRERVHAETVILIGSAKLFAETAHYFLDLARDGPGNHADYPHFCKQFHSGDGILGDAREIHVVRHDQWTHSPAPSGLGRPTTAG